MKNRLKEEKLPLEEEVLNLDIKTAVEEALQMVVEDMNRFGINAKENDWKYMQIPLFTRLKKNGQDDKDIDEDDVELNENSEENEIDQDVANCVNNEDCIIMAKVADLISNEIPNRKCDDSLETSSISLKDFSHKVHSISEKSPYIKLTLAKKSSIIKKSSYCWLLDQSNSRVSTDRLKRFIGSASKTQKKTPSKKSQLPLAMKKSKQKLPMDQTDSTSTDSSTDSDSESFQIECFPPIYRKLMDSIYT